ncbi:glucose dehydrogenase [FAD, quinone]-like [Cherax quadricarinatus]
MNAFLMQSESDWNYFTVPQKHGLFNYNNNACAFPLGRVVGGSSTINWMMYVRGNRRDYDHWQALGNPGWDYHTVLRYFKKAEHYRGTRNKNTAEYHGRGGPLSVDDKRWGAPLLAGYLKAGQELGYSIIDANGPEQIGFSVADMTQVNGGRSSVAQSYLRPALDRGNLHIVSRAHVTQILFDDEKRAVGVTYEHLGKRLSEWKWDEDSVARHLYRVSQLLSTDVQLQQDTVCCSYPALMCSFNKTPCVVVTQH